MANTAGDSSEAFGTGDGVCYSEAFATQGDSEIPACWGKAPSIQGLETLLPHVHHSQTPMSPHRAAIHAAIFAFATMLGCLAGAVDSTPTKSDIARWIAELGDGEFVIRERAQQRLLAAGEAAKEALLRAKKDQNLEVRTRAARLLANVRRMEFQQRVEQFLAGERMDEPLPGWDAFRKLAGDSPKTKLLFVDVVKGDEALLQAVDAGRDVSAELAARVQDATRNRYVPPPQENIAMITFLAAHLTAEQYQRVYSSLYSFYRNSTVSNAIRSKPPLMALFSNWLRHILKQEGTGSSQSRILYLVLEYDVKEIAIEFARKTLRNTGVSQSTLQQAVTCVGRFGDKSDLPLLLKHLKDTRVTNTWSRGQGKPLVKTQLKDRALAMAIHLVGKKPADFGFPFPIANNKYVYQVYSCGFETEEHRKTAHKNWEKWWAEHRDEHLKKEPDATKP